MDMACYLMFKVMNMLFDVWCLSDHLFDIAYIIPHVILDIYNIPQVALQEGIYHSKHTSSKSQKVVQLFPQFHSNIKIVPLLPL
jgi:hypothetical protein